MRIAKALLFDARGNALILRRSSTHPYYAFEPDLPGGIIEKGESFEQGLVREISEETGIAVDAALLHDVADRTGIGATKRLYVAILPDRPDVTISWEHDQFEWIEPRELLGRLASRDSFLDIAVRYVRDEL